MEGTPDWLKQRVAAYYQETTEESYLAWAGDALALHLGLSDDPAAITDRAVLERGLVAMNALLADHARVGAGTRVLDAGSGVGGSSIWLSRERGASVVGVTLDPGQVALARRYAAERGAAGATFATMDFASTTFAAGSFDVVWNLESLCHAGHPRAYFAHAFELLADGGRFVCADFFRGRGGPDCDAMCEGWVLPDLQTPEAIADELRAAGFGSVEIIDLTARVIRSAEVMGSIGSHQVLKLKLAAATGAAPRPSYESHFRASFAAAAGLASGEITYALVAAARPPRV